jgi:beta-mannosidase
MHPMVYRYKKQKTIYIPLLAFLTLFVNCNMNKEMPEIIFITHNWEFREAGSDQWYPASIPGTVHADLEENGLIKDPLYRMNEDDVQWIEKKDWEYRTTFEIGKETLKKQVVEMEFRGLDTYADVYLNEHLILQADNMFLGWKVDCKPYLVEGENSLRVYFHSQVNEGMKKLKQLDYIIPATNEQAPIDQRTNVFTRKAPFHYGWDWGPRLVTSGIWRPVSIKAWNNAVIEDVYIVTESIADNQAVISATIEIMAEEDGTYDLNLFIDRKDSGVKHRVRATKGINTTRFEIVLDNPRLWWPNGLGDANLYNMDFRLQKGRNIIDSYNIDYGVRTVQLVQQPDDVGHSFYFEVNGVPVFMKGANIIPSNTLTPSVTEDTYRKLIHSAVDANMNMLRVWGGAIYEEDIFYKLCDENGLLVWQDFMFACALQPGDEPHLENIKKEAEYNVRRLRNFASIALWCGNNENLMAWHNWGWQDYFNDEQRDFMWRTYERIFYEILPQAVQKYDPKNSYWASSPSAIGDQLADRKSGDEHDWTIWFYQRPFSDYWNNVPRFVSEWGFQAFPGINTIRTFSNPEDHDYDSKAMRHRQRSRMNFISPGFDGNDMIRQYMGWYYDVPEDFERFVYVSQLLQAKGYKTAIEAHRSHMPHCMGSLYWQLNDSWPTISWSTVDHFYRWKASHYAVKKAFEPLIVTAHHNSGELKIYSVSDMQEQINATLVAMFMDLRGTTFQTIEKPVLILPNTSVVISEQNISGWLDKKENVVVSLEIIKGEEVLADNIFYFTEPKYLNLGDPEIEFSLEKVPGGYLLNIVCGKLLKGLFIDTPDPDSHFSDNFFDLLPGRKKSVLIQTDMPLTVDDIKLMYLNP